MSDGETDRSAECAEPPVVVRRWRAFAERHQERAAAALLDQQLWCWGRDVKHPAGNALARFGLRGGRPPGPNGSPCYVGPAAGGAVALWGFGVFFGRPGAGGVYVHRFGFAPLLTAATAVEGVTAPEGLPRLAVPTTAAEWQRLRDLLAAFAGWAAGYEHWAAEALGPGYRDRSLAQRGKPPAVPAGQSAAAWERLAKQCRGLREVRVGGDGWQKPLDRLRAQAAVPPSPPRRPPAPELPRRWVTLLTQAAGGRPRGR